MTLLALVVSAIPFVFGLARLISTASDWRYLAVALASTIGANLILRRPGSGGSARVAWAFICAGLLAALVALAVGARSIVSIGFVSLGFAVCSVTGAVLLLRTRHPSTSVG